MSQYRNVMIRDWRSKYHMLRSANEWDRSSHLMSERIGTEYRIRLDPREIKWSVADRRPNPRFAEHFWISPILFYLIAYIELLFWHERQAWLMTTSPYCRARKVERDPSHFVVWWQLFFRTFFWILFLNPTFLYLMGSFFLQWLFVERGPKGLHTSWRLRTPYLYPSC